LINIVSHLYSVNNILFTQSSKRRANIELARPAN